MSASKRVQPCIHVIALALHGVVPVHLERSRIDIAGIMAGATDQTQVSWIIIIWLILAPVVDHVVYLCRPPLMADFA